ncbi:MAG: chromosome segregation protein SMC [Cytophagales bacterium]|nr:chromosome segregation protein SMC [Cytophagales bacterium]
MRLKQLDIQGFKSFGDRVSLSFQDGITGIVGPNGCGKSNILDALRWVLGEQRPRVLRSEKMENILFNGGRGKKALSMAEVSVSFDNTKHVLPTEYSEVKLTRRLYRSGESEYEINNASCRLKDVTELLMGSGTSFHAYSIMELRMIDDIIYDHEKARRMLFEEAAGIGRSKFRKKETLQKMSDMRGDILRLDDLLLEIEKGMERLKTQSEQAEKYLSLKEEHENLSIYIAHTELREWMEKKQRLEKQKTSTQKEQRIEKGEIALEQARLQEKKQSHDKQQNQIAQKQRDLNDYLAKIQSKQTKIQLHQKKIEVLQVQKKQQAVHFQQYEKEIKDFEAEIQKSSLEAQEQEKKHRDLQHKEKVLRQNLQSQYIGFEKLVQEREVLERDCREKREIFLRREQSLQQQHLRHSSLREQLKSRSSDIQALHTQYERLKEQEKQIEERYKQDQDSLDKLLVKEKALERRIGSVRDRWEEELSREKQLEKDFHALERRYLWQKKAFEDFLGFPESIRFLKKSYSELPLLSELVRCPEEYRRGLEAFLGPWLGYFVSDTRAEAMAYLSALASKSLGHASFFILEEVPQRSLRVSPFVERGKACLEILKYDLKYERLMKFLLGGIYFRSGSSTSPSSPSRDPNCIRIQNALISHQQFMLTGGSRKAEEDILGRREHLSGLEKEYRDLSETWKKVQQSCEGEQVKYLSLEEEKKQLETSETRESLYQVSAQKESLAGLLSQVQDQKLLMEKDKERMETLLLPAEEELKKWTNLHLQQKENLRIADEKLSLLLDKYHQEEKKLREIEKLIHQVELELGIHESETRRIQEKQDLIAFNAERTERRKKDLHKEQEKIGEEIRGLQSEYQEIERELVAVQLVKEKKETDIVQAEELLFRLRAELDGSETLLADLRKREHQQKIIEVDIDKELSSVDLEIRNLKDQVFTLFGKDISKVEISLPQAFREIVAARSERQRLARLLEDQKSINPMAADSFKEEQKRYEFLKRERKDLESAEKSLLRTLKKIDDTAHVQFMKSFEEIRSSFKELFQSIFEEGDDCDIILSSLEDPVSSDIDIIARPRRKKPLSIRQLSGGERALTALSLLFAAYLHKASPFCILDEVDAPLDDVNTLKFLRILRRLSDRSQFLVITHNKTTMSEASMLYGLSMQKGSSMVIPVNLPESSASSS